MQYLRIIGKAGRATTAVVALLLAVLLLPSTQSSAAGLVKGTARGTASVTSGKWGATVSDTSLSFGLLATATQDVTVTNVGTIALSGLSYTVTVSTPILGSPTFTIFACTVAWVAEKCGGGAGTQVGTTFKKSTTTTVSSSVVPPLTGSVYLQVTPTAVIFPVDVTLSTEVSSATQLRAHLVTNQ
jgi:hypothetical protein